MYTSPSCLTEVEKSWLAAMIDGEGCIRITRGKRKRKNVSWRFSPYVEFTNTDLRLIERFEELAKPWITSARLYKDEGPKNKNGYRITMQHRKCKGFLKAIYPYLIAKGEQAQVVFEYLDLTKGPGPSNKPILNELNELYIRTRILNRRGTAPLDVEALKLDIAPNYQG